MTIMDYKSKTVQGTLFTVEPCCMNVKRTAEFTLNRRIFEL